MNSPVRPPLTTFLPPNAPFSPEQQEWLNGLFAGLIEGEAAALSPQQAASLLPGVDITAKPTDDDDDEAPWHDQSLSLAERMTLAEGRPLRRKLMAAMGQQDCGQCGYNCKDYADAIFTKKDERLNLCVPGGKETARMLKTLYAEIDAAPAPIVAKDAAKEPAVSKPAAAGPSRDHPALATFVSRTLLNRKGSAKQTWHIEFDLDGSGVEYTVGDAFGLFPTNDPGLVDAILKTLNAPANFPIGGRPLRDVLLDSVSLSPAPDMLFQLFSYITGGERRQKAKALGAGEDPDDDAATLDVLAAIEKFPGIRPDPEAFIEALDPLAPRLYSISSSPKVDRGRLSLTVDTVRYDVGKRARLGVASTYLASRVNPGDKVNIYVQKSPHFGLPADPALPIIMIGPGTGVAPFRAIHQERKATGAAGENWLFYGHQHSETDFFYREELSGMKASGLLTHLYLAWSRDDAEKFYVQDRMRQVGPQLWQCIAKGAHIYVCGAIKMGQDVERALVDIVSECGVRSINEAVAFVKELKKSGRYQTDVY
jgi:sulfite reductase (NADPH) flavoprotein alpha-component